MAKRLVLSRDRKETLFVLYLYAMFSWYLMPIRTTISESIVTGDTYLLDHFISEQIWIILTENTPYPAIQNLKVLKKFLPSKQ